LAIRFQPDRAEELWKTETKVINTFINSPTNGDKKQKRSRVTNHLELLYLIRLTTAEGMGIIEWAIIPLGIRERKFFLNLVLRRILCPVQDYKSGENPALIRQILLSYPTGFLAIYNRPRRNQA
jgi:hypothetical protein